MRLFKLFAVSVAIMLHISPTALAIERDQKAPEFTVPGRSNDVSLSAYRGQIVYLDFWASWCGPCKKSFPWMNALQEKFGAKGLKIIAINLDSKTEDGTLFLTKVPAIFLIGFDKQGTVAKQYQVQAMPSSVLIDRDGKILEVHKGFNDTIAKKIEGEIEALLKKTP
ncbi:TlpA family protein disulfide reductase [Undibacterium sp.]|uniref:TlpA family protein disulfide reductase n=1 Tax=Undibacterium sp. TaxID=1914977 RepID=UPI0037514B05